MAKKIRSGQAVSAEDEIKVLQMTSMLNDASTMNISLDKVYASRRAVNQVLPEVAQSTVPARGAIAKATSPENLAQKIAEYKKRLAKNPRLASGGGSGATTGKGTKTMGQQVMEETKMLLSQDRPDEFAKHGWFDAPKR